MKCIIHSAHIILTPLTQQNLLKIINTFEKTVKSFGIPVENCMARASIVRSTHHRKGYVIEAMVQLETPKKTWHARRTSGDVYDAVRGAVKEIRSLIKEERKKMHSIAKRGALMLKVSSSSRRTK
jgi:ribosome-associated translation inhibitor RaiA